MASSLLRVVGGRAACLPTTGVRALSMAAEYPAHVLNAPATEVTTLGNGVRVASEDGHGETATVGVYIDVGSRHETDASSGVAHFLEHLNFKGTSKRSQTDLELEIENMGGHLNAYTSREHTVYYAKVFKDDVPKAVDILGDILTNSSLDPGAVERERNVILAEYDEVNSQPEEVIIDKLHETAYQGTGLARTILGPVENIQNITRDDLERFIKTNYTGQRVVVAGAGAVEHAQLTELADKVFGGLPSAPPSGYTPVEDAAVFTGSDIRSREDALGLGHVAVTFETGGWQDEHAFALMVMQELLGSWDRNKGVGPNMASHLCRKVGEDQLAHSVAPLHNKYSDTGLFGVYAVAEPTKLHALMYTIMYELVRLAHKTTDEEVARARTQLKTSMLGSLDGSTAVCEDIGRSMLVFGRRLTPAEIFARIDAVDVDAVRAAASKYIEDQDLACAAVGHIHELPDYNWLRRRTYWLRY